MEKALDFRIFEQIDPMKNKHIFIGFIFFLLPSIFNAQTFSTLGEIYDFKPGDTFHSFHFYCYNDVSFQLVRTVVHKKNEFDNAIEYINKVSVFDFIHANPPILSDTSLFESFDTLYIPWPDSILFSDEDLIYQDPLAYNAKWINVNFTEVEGEIRVEKYCKGLGKVLNGWETSIPSTCAVRDSLIFYKKKDETWGTTLLHTKEIQEHSRVYLYPNPAEDYVWIHLSTPPEGKSIISIYNVQGTQVRKTEVPCWHIETKNKIDITGLPPGLYFVYLSTINRVCKGTLIKSDE